MASTDERKTPPPPPTKEEQQPGELTTVWQHVVQKGAELTLSLGPAKQLKQHACRSQLNQDFLRCTVYDGDGHHVCLIGVEYIMSERVFETLPSEKQKLWPSHAYEIKSGLWIHPRVPDFVEKVEPGSWPRLMESSDAHGRLTEVRRSGDKLPIGAPVLMTSPQSSGWGLLKPDVVMKRDDRCGVRADQLKATREDIKEPERHHPRADHWTRNGMGFAVDVVYAEMKRVVPFP
ncbi:hypothetical protein ACJRO7_021111 [Eucalyptus globulus]|uniref:Uncharacterized protein n=1 Tax=Eucalyptus globulus TaxID=34317 RepID=A0ABD3KPX8_EUCGL